MAVGERRSECGATTHVRWAVSRIRPQTVCASRWTGMVRNDWADCAGQIKWRSL